jgi:TonB family protein
MRRMILTTLVLLPVMAQAQAGTSTEPRQPTSSAMNVAELTQPALPGALAINAGVVPAASVATFGMSERAAIRESVQTRMVDNMMDAAMMKAGTLEYAMGSVPTEASSPRVTRAVELELSTQEMAEQPRVTHVVLHAIVDENGIPRNVAITQSAGSVIDRKAIQAVNQYRFKPATLDNKPTWASVSITIKIQKP